MRFGERYTTSEMDEYDKKFAEMQKYIPFLEAMIERLQNVKDKSREVQLQKMQSLHGILSNSKRKLKIETLQRCEDVLQKLHNKVEKVDTTLKS
ncbi:Mediator of RNA polymerase II transcription subunit 15 [Anthophora quadrimaculata]